MSYHLEQKTSINNERILRESLKEMGFEVVEHEHPVAIRGWRMEILRTKCELVLPRERTGKGADIGFHREDDGNYSIVSDSFANKDMAQFVASLKVNYHQATAIGKAKAKGLRVLSRGQWVEKDGRRWLQMKVGR